MQKLYELHIKDCKIFQDDETFMFGVDSVLLSDFAADSIHKTDEVLDLGCGNGIIPILLAKTSNAKKIAGLEIQKEQAEMAEKSVKFNSLEDKIKIVNGDVKRIQDFFESKTFSVVTTNPPYAIYNGQDNKNDSITIARQEKSGTLEDFVNAASFVLNPNGKFFMIHRPNRLAEIFKCLEQNKFQVKRIQFVFPSADKDATMVLIEARKDAKPDLKVEKSIIVYGKNGERLIEYKCGKCGG